MEFVDSDTLKWDKSEAVHTEPDFILGECDYQNPPKYFTLRGRRYEFTGFSMFYTAGAKDGKHWYQVFAPDNPEREAIWVTDEHEGEFIQVLIPRSMKNCDFIVS